MAAESDGAPSGALFVVAVSCSAYSSCVGTKQRYTCRRHRAFGFRTDACEGRPLRAPSSFAVMAPVTREEMCQAFKRGRLGRMETLAPARCIQ